MQFQPGQSVSRYQYKTSHKYELAQFNISPPPSSHKDKTDEVSIERIETVSLSITVRKNTVKIIRNEWIKRIKIYEIL